MREVILQGRGGQGAQTAGNLLAAAVFAQGLQLQCFASYGGARRGTPVSSYLRGARDQSGALGRTVDGVVRACHASGASGSNIGEHARSGADGGGA